MMNVFYSKPYANITLLDSRYIKTLHIQNQDIQDTVNL